MYREISRVEFTSSLSDFLYLEIYIGNATEMSWPSRRSSVFECISITNTIFNAISHPIECKKTCDLCTRQLQRTVAALTIIIYD